MGTKIDSGQGEDVASEKDVSLRMDNGRVKGGPSLKIGAGKNSSLKKRWGQQEDVV